MRSDIRRQRAKLYIESGGLCHYCQCKTVFPRANGLIDGVPNLATIDHLRSKLDPTRHLPNLGNEKRRVLSCYSCNQTRSLLEQIAKAFYDGVYYLHIDGQTVMRKKQSETLLSTIG